MKHLSSKLLAETVVSRRKAIKMSQLTLSKKTGINRSIISRLESEDYTPSVDQLLALSTVLGFDNADVLEEEEKYAGPSTSRTKCKQYHCSPRTMLVVKLNGKFIKGMTSKVVFANAIDNIGAKAVYDTCRLHNIKINGMLPLSMNKDNLPYPNTSDKISDGWYVQGNISNLIYQGDHYLYVIHTELEQDFVVYDEDLWNMEDRVGLIMPVEKMTFSLKK